jgi:hypothetical protein
MLNTKITTMTLQKQLTHSDAVDVIAQAASAATAAIAQAAEAAAKVVANAATEAAKIANAKGQDDHDLLIRIETRMEGLKSDIKELKDGTSKRIDCLESEKLSTHDSYAVLYKKDVDTTLADQENRIRSNEKNIIRILTFGSLLLILIGIAETLIFKFVH